MLKRTLEEKKENLKKYDELIAQGIHAKEASAQLGVRLQTIYDWRSKLNRAEKPTKPHPTLVEIPLTPLKEKKKVVVLMGEPESVAEMLKSVLSSM